MMWRGDEASSAWMDELCSSVEFLLFQLKSNNSCAGYKGKTVL